MKNFFMENKLLSVMLAAEALFIGLLLFKAITVPRGEETLVCQDFSAVGNVAVETVGAGVGTMGVTLEEGENPVPVVLMASRQFCIHSGAYAVTVEYEAAFDPEDPAKNSNNVIGELKVSTEKNPIALSASSIILSDGSSECTSRLWLRLGARTDDLKVDVIYNGVGKLLVRKVQIKESMVYRYVRVAVYLFLIVIADFLYLFFGKNTLLRMDIGKKQVIFCLGLIAFGSSLTCFTDFLFSGHDLDFHLARIVLLSDAIEDLQIPQRIQFTAKNGYGYATPLFYGELLLYVPAALYCLWLPLQTCYQVYMVMVNVLTCGISYWCFSRISKSRWIGVAGACMYTFSAYRMTNLLTRAAVGEYTAMAFLPLACYGFWNIYRKDKLEKIQFRECLPVILGITGIIQTHTLTLLMSALFIFCLVVICWRRTFTKYCFFALAKSAFVILMLNLWFLYPMLSSMIRMDLRWDDIKEIEMRGVYLVQLFGVFLPGSAAGENVNRGMQNEMPLTLGITLTLGLLLWLICCLQREKERLDGCPEFRQSAFFAVFSLGAVFLASNLFWSDNISTQCEKFEVLFGAIQFPWRFLAVASVFACFTAVLCLGVVQEKRGFHYALKVAFALVIPGLLSTGLYIAQYTANVGEYRNYVTRSTDSLYLPKDTDVSQTAVKRPLTGEGVSASSTIYEKGAYTLACSNSLGGDSYVTFPVFNYENYHAYDKDTGNRMEITTGENNRVQVTLPAGYSGTLVLRYEEPFAWRLCEALALLTLAVMAFYFLREHRKRKKGHWL